MSPGFNQSILLGRLVAEPEQIKTRSGSLFIKAIIVATMFRKTAELSLKYVPKGDLVHLPGRLDSQEWKADDGKMRLTLSFLVELLPTPRKEGRDS